MPITKAVIVAAGLSSRLYPLTIDQPKGLLPLGDSTILQRSIDTLRQCGITNIAVVVGYMDQMMRSKLSGVDQFIYNPFFKQCNNLGSCWMAHQFIGNDPFLYMHGDLAYDPQILQVALDINDTSHCATLVTDFKKCNEEEMKVTTDEQGFLLKSSKEIPLDKAQGEWTGIAIINHTKNVLNQFEQTLRDEELNRYDTFAFNRMVKDGHKFKCTPTNGMKWLEIDFAEDYKLAQEIFTFFK